MEVDLVLDAVNFMNGMKKAAERSQETSERIAEGMKLAKEAVIGLGEAMAIDWFKEQIDKALEYGESIKKVGEATGLSSKFIQQFAYQSSQVGVAMGSSNAALEHFTVALGRADQGNQKFLKRLTDLGVTSRDPQQALLQLAEGVKKFDTSTADAAADAKKFLGDAQFAPILREGAEGFNEAAKAANELGIVLDDKVIGGAVQAEHKISALKMVISAEWANVIDQNAGAIANLASEFIKAAGAAAEFFSSLNNAGNLSILAHPTLTNISSRLMGNDPNKTRADAVSGLLGNKSGRDKLLADNTEALNTLNAAGQGKGLDDGLYGFRDAGINGVGDNAKGRWDAHQKLIAMRKQILASYASPAAEHGEGGNTGALPPLKTHKKKTRDRSADQTALFDRSLDQEKLEGLDLKGSLTTDPAWQAQYQRDAMAFEWGSQGQDGKWVGGSKDREIDDNLAAGKYGDKNGALAKARADELKQQNDLNAQLRYAVVNRKEDDALATQQLALQTNSLDLQKEHLDAQQSLARTATEREKIGAQILDIEYEQKRLALQAELDAKKRNRASPEDIKLTQDKLNALSGEKADAKALNAKQNMGPLASYLDQIPKSIDDINESLQQTCADGLGKFTDGIMAAVDGTGKLGDAFKGLATTIISGIEKIVLEEAIIKPLGNALSGALGGLSGSLGGLFGMGHRANGGMSQPGLYEVGERGPEIVSIGAASNVVNHEQMRGLGGGGGNWTVNSTVYGVNDPAQVRSLSAQTIMQATPALMRMSGDDTTRRLRRPSMR